jgi:antitoxin CcdA
MGMVGNRTLAAGTMRKAARRTNVTLDATLVEEARQLGVNVSQASNRGLEEAVRKARADRWLEENKPALDAYNEYVAEHGLPLAKFRSF